MEYPLRESCIILSKHERYEAISPYLIKQYSLFHANNVHKAERLIRQTKISCLIAYVDDYEDNYPDKLKHLTSLSPHLSIVGVIEHNKPYAILKCGLAGIKRFVMDDNLSILGEIVLRSMYESLDWFSWKEWGIQIDICPPIIQNAIKVIKKNYLTLQSVEDISSELNVTSRTLRRGFKQYCHTSPKRLLIALKMKHAEYLMKQSKLNLKEIGTLAGFHNDCCFRDCFKKLVYSCPRDFRNHEKEICFIKILRGE